jgi:hypothetical protein
MWRRRSVAAAIGAAVIAVAALTAALWPSGAARSAAGPFGPAVRVSENAECIPIPGSIITYGFEAVRNAGSSAATIQKIGYVDPHHLKILDTFVVPVHNRPLYGGEYGYPPKWLQSERTVTVPPAHGTALNDYSNVIIVTKLIGETGHADAIYVDYKENGALYFFRSITSLTVKHGVRTGRCT